jgi:hypothetical protein
MNLQRLAAKQKRYLDIRHALESSTVPEAIGTPLRSALEQYKQTLAELWSKQTVSPEDSSRLDSLERSLETLHNEARLLAKPIHAKAV